jgi:hypothetical protein
MFKVGSSKERGSSKSEVQRSKERGSSKSQVQSSKEREFKVASSKFKENAGLRDERTVSQ